MPKNAIKFNVTHCKEYSFPTSRLCEIDSLELVKSILLGLLDRIDQSVGGAELIVQDKRDQPSTSLDWTVK